uniref:KIF-binding protein n=1 Tax=Trepomonas sp. PC1 TaxID=1076344 RepID=A0A146KHX7_9EUKA|eukprot:JAP95205.1 KIF-1 binding protein C terminal domain-containing protein [Trepomonas sp. PC1]
MLDDYILNYICAKISFDTLEGNAARQYMSQCEQYINPLVIKLDQLVGLIKQNPLLFQYVLSAFNLKCLQLGQSESFKQCIQIYDLTDRVYAQILKENLSNDLPSFYTYSPEQYSHQECFNLFIHATFFVAQAYGNDEQPSMSAKYCQKTLYLQRQLGGFNKVEYIKNSVDLTRYYTQNDKFLDSYLTFKQCREVYNELLAELENKQPKFIKNKESLNHEDAVTEIEDLKLTQNDYLSKLTENEREAVYTFFKELVTFYLQLLNYTLMMNLEITTIDTGMSLEDFLVLIDQKNPFEVSLQFINDVFNEAEENAQKALQYFLLDGFTTSYCQILLDQSSLLEIHSRFQQFDLIAFQKKRIKLLNQLSRELSSQHFPDLLEEINSHLCEARYEIFDFQYKKLVSKCPQVDKQLYFQKQFPEVAEEIQKTCSFAAQSIEQFQQMIENAEKIAVYRCKVQTNAQNVQFDQWIKYMHEDSLQIYIDGVFKQAIVFSKIPTEQRKQMMQRAMLGFEYCQKVWEWMKENKKGDVEESLKYVGEMLNLMRMRLSQL